ncbi:MAG: FAD-binding oxidoreductase, partial [Gordonia sp. (in: high G+C Gram-positive bacteria)]|jgi:FAD/FMN-containing dehydrogenase|nr:FAD-binding oxidoreductase [Gordonia sp. (in: high G+C Gram-positive bacteria)]
VDEAGRAALWRYRELHNETIRSLGVPLKVDVSVPIDAIPGFEARLHALVEDHAPGSELILYGHLGDGNVHVNLLDVPAEHRQTLADGVLEIVVALDGSISAEHGVGRAKAASIGLGRDAVDIAAMWAIKGALDPGRVLNPGVIFPESG